MPDTVLSVPRVHLLPEAFLDALVRLIDPVLCSHGAFLFFSTSNLAFKMLYYNDLLSLSLSLSPSFFPTKLLALRGSFRSYYRNWESKSKDRFAE